MEFMKVYKRVIIKPKNSQFSPLFHQYKRMKILINLIGWGTGRDVMGLQVIFYIFSHYDFEDKSDFENMKSLFT